MYDRGMNPTDELQVEEVRASEADDAQQTFELELVEEISIDGMCGVY